MDFFQYVVVLEIDAGTMVVGPFDSRNAALRYRRTKVGPAAHRADVVALMPTWVRTGVEPCPSK